MAQYTEENIYLVIQDIPSDPEQAEQLSEIHDGFLSRLARLSKKRLVYNVIFSDLKTYLENIDGRLICKNRPLIIYHVNHGFLGLFNLFTPQEYCCEYMTTIKKLNPDKLKIFGCYTANAVKVELIDPDIATQIAHISPHIFQSFAQELSRQVDFLVTGYCGESIETSKQPSLYGSKRKETGEMHSWCLFFPSPLRHGKRASCHTIRQSLTAVTYERGHIIGAPHERISFPQYTAVKIAASEQELPPELSARLREISAAKPSSENLYIGDGTLSLPIGPETSEVHKVPRLSKRATCGV